MKHIQIIFLILFALLLGGCRKDFEQVENTKTVFQLIFPDTYNAELYPENIPLTIKNNITGETRTISSDQQGRVETDLLPGTYSVTASRSYTAEETLELTGNEEESFVNASVSPVVIDGEKTIDVQLIGSKTGGLIIREFYYTGSRTPANGSYLYDGFIEIYNNSNTVQRLDSLCIGATRSAATSNTASSAAYNFLSAYPNHVYLNQVFMIPSDEEPRYLQPRESLVIAIDGINHKDDPNGNPNSPVNLGAGIADYEVFWAYTSTQPDIDYPEVPNMLHVFSGSTSGFDWNIGVSGAGLILFAVEDISALDVRYEPDAAVSGTTQYIGVPVANVIDGVDATGNSSILPANKRLPLAVDAGMTTIGATINGKSVRRKVKTVINEETIFVDTNNSSNDFEVNDNPSPRKWN